MTGNHGTASALRRTDPLARPTSRRADIPIAEGEMDAHLSKLVRRTSWLRQGFYFVVLLVALAGQVSGAVEALGIPLFAAVPAVAALELGGIVVLANADVRRRLGEQAFASRLLSAAIAAAAVTFNWLAHRNHLLGGFFAGMSALGYLVWLMHTENQRRDRLRVKGDLPPTTPSYEVVGHWLRHPWLTARAKAMAKADPRLGLYDSLAAARAEVKKERRQAAIAKVLHSKIKSAVDPRTADIAIAVYDLDEIAGRLAEQADYDGLTAIIAADLTPHKLAPNGVLEQRKAPALASRTAGSGATRAIGRAGGDQTDGDQTDGDQTGGDQTGGDQTGGEANDGLAISGGQSGDGQAVNGHAINGHDAGGRELMAATAWPTVELSRVVIDDESRDGADAGREAAGQAERGRQRGRRSGRASGRATPPTPSLITPDLREDVERRLGQTRTPAPRQAPRGVEAIEPGAEGQWHDAVAPDGTLRDRVHAALDAAVHSGDQREDAELISEIFDELGLNDLERISAASYVQSWRREAELGQRIRSA